MSESTTTTTSPPLIQGIAHINLTIPPGTLPHATTFYGTTLGLTPRAVPVAQASSLAWFDVADSGQQIHIAYAKDPAADANPPASARHACFRVGSADALVALQRRILGHLDGGGEAAPMACDPVGESSGAKSEFGEYPSRFFARDFAGNRLEFST